MIQLPKLIDLKKTINERDIEIVEGSFDLKAESSQGTFFIQEKLMISDFLNLVNRLDVKLIYLDSVTKDTFIKATFLDLVQDNYWDEEDWFYEKENELDEGNEIEQHIELKIKQIQEIFSIYKENQEKESTTMISYSMCFSFNGILHYYIIKNENQIIEINKQIADDIEKIEKLEIEIGEKRNERDEQSEIFDKKNRIKMAEELIEDPIFVKLRNNRMRLEYIADKYNLNRFETQPILDKVQLVLIKRRER